MDLGLKGRVAIIAGGSRGIGRATALALSLLIVVVAAPEPSSGAHIHTTVLDRLEVGGRSFGVGVDAGADKLYVSYKDTQGLALAAIRPSSMDVITDIRLPYVGEAAPVVAVDPVIAGVYTVDAFTTTIFFIDARTNKVKKYIDSGEAVRPYGVAVDSTRGRVHWTESKHLTVFDAATAEVIAKVPIEPVLSTPTTPRPEAGSPLEVAVNPQTNRIYVTSDNVVEGGGEVFVIDGKTESMVRSIRVGLRPQGIAVNPVTNRVYVANSGGHTVSVIDGSLDSVVGEIQLPASPQSMAVNATTNTVYTTLSAGLAIIDGATGAVRTIDTGGNGLAVDEKNDLVYLTYGESVLVLGNGTGSLPGGGGPPRTGADGNLVTIGLALVAAAAAAVGAAHLWRPKRS